ncbi:MAG TPA: VOC family protein [Acidimicrobiales bacterium]|nr:VOC family protein [Acidimicrobiales bacterium]
MHLEIGIDCSDPDRLADFWEAALGAPGRRGDGRPYVQLLDVPGLPPVYFQRVPEGKVVKNRLHLDLFVADIEREVERLVALGATAHQEVHEGGERWRVLTDPEGNEFCICKEGGSAAGA